MLLKEVCCETLEQSMIAERRGADRLELCAELKVGGLTPELELARDVLRFVNIPVMVMIRCRAGDFCYSSTEINTMASQIEAFKGMAGNKPAGFVLGALTPDKAIDVPATAHLAKVAAPYPVTFHKAIDECRHPVAALQLLKTIPGITRVLSSGGQATAIEGAPNLRAMIAAAGQDLTVVVAGRVTSENLAEVHRTIGGCEYHGRLIVGQLN